MALEKGTFRRFNILRVLIIIMCINIVAYFFMKEGNTTINQVVSATKEYWRSKVPPSSSSKERGKSPQKPEDKFTSSRPCTFGLFREVFARDHYYPGGGRWVKGSSGKAVRYQPQACKFNYERTPKAFMDRCFAKANLSSIMTIGDSTASRYFAALTKESNISCNKVRTEELKEKGFVPDIGYYSTYVPKEVIKFVQTQFRFCSGCRGVQMNCYGDSIQQNASGLLIKFEHLPQTMILDDSVQITFPGYNQAAKIVDRIWSITSQEFIFRYFLHDRYPQVFLIFLPFIHAKNNMKIKRLKMEILYFKSLVEQYFPNTTKLVYMPAYSEFDSTRGGYWKNRRFEGLLASQKIKKMNDILYEILEPDLLRNDGRVFSFIDVFEASLPHASWCTDGVHMKPVWYENVMTMFWETFCNSVLLHQF